MMSFLPSKHRVLTHKWLLISAIIFFAVLFALCSAWLTFSTIYRDRIIPGAYLNDEYIGGLTQEQLREKINSHIDALQKNGIIFRLKDVMTTISPIMVSPEAEYAKEVIIFNTDKMIYDAYSIGHNGSILSDIEESLSCFFKHKVFNYQADVDQETVIALLNEKFKQLESPAKNAELTYDPDSGFFINPEKSGQSIDYPAAIDTMKQNIAKGSDDEITLTYTDGKPTITKQEALRSIYSAEAIASLAPIKLKLNDSVWTITYERLASWLSLEKKDDGIGIALNKTAITGYLDEVIGGKINRDAHDAKFTIENGKLLAFQSNVDGIKIDSTSTLYKIEDNIKNSTSSDIEVVTTIIKSSMQASSTEDFGIKEIIGVGVSNFAGSPKNRVRNIKVGAASVNGTIINPGEEFSLLKTLGSIDEKSGYLPELVIKDNKTTPEFGGGLCQIGTTVFRGATNSGLPITQRRNHSYRVSYYEPAGTDATIYDPAPDFRFVNDTGNYILIKSRFAGSKIYFEFWGTKDGRKIEKDEPTIYNIVKPEPAKLIKTLDLKPGEKKCTEKAHNGADAFFNYKVTYPNGEVKEKKFYSHYVPWQEVCLIGVTKDEMKNSSSTTEIIDTSKSTSTKATTSPTVKTGTTTPIIKQATSTKETSTSTATNQS